MTETTMRRIALAVISVGICLLLGWPVAYTIAQTIFGEAGLNGGPGLTRPDDPSLEARFAVTTTDSMTFFMTNFTSGGTPPYTHNWSSNQTGQFLLSNTAVNPSYIAADSNAVTTITLITTDNAAASDTVTATFRTKTLPTADARGVAIAMNSTAADSLTASDFFPKISFRLPMPLASGGVLHANDFDGSNPEHRAMAQYLAATVDAIEADASRWFTAKGLALAESLKVYKPSIVIRHYIRFDHAPTEADPSISYASAEAGAGPLFYKAETVGQDYYAFNAAQDTAIIWNPGKLTQAAAWNHWKTKDNLDTDGYDRAITFEYADSIAAVFNRYPDLPVDQFFIDYFGIGPNIWDPGSGIENPDFDGGTVDYNGDGVTDYTSYGSWANTAIRDGYWAWHKSFVEQLQADFPWARIMTNGSLGGQWGQRNAAGWVAVRPLIDGQNFERNGPSAFYSAGFSNIGQTTPYDSIKMASQLYDTYGKEWSTLAGPYEQSEGSSDQFIAERARVAMLYGLLGASWTGFLGNSGLGFDEFGEVTAALTATISLDPGRVVSVLIEDTESLPGLQVLRRWYENGYVEGIFSGGFPTSPTSASVRWVPWTYTANFNVETSDNLTFTFTSQSSTNIPGGVDNNYWILADIGQTEYSGSPVQHTFPAGSGSVDVRLTSNSIVAGAYGIIEKSAVLIEPVQVAAVPPDPNNAPVASFTVADADADSLDFEFDASGSTDSDGTIVNYSWNFGDSPSNVSGASATREKTYAPCDCERTVTLIVTDNDGAADTTSTTVQIAAPVLGGPLAISGIVGTLAEGDTITINGSGFNYKDKNPGPNPAAPLIWEEFNGTSGQTIPTYNSAWSPRNGGGSPGGWITNTNQRDGTTNAFNDGSSGSTQPNFDSSVRSFALTDTIFFSGWHFIDNLNGSVVYKYTRIGPEGGDPYSSIGSTAFSDNYFLVYRPGGTYNSNTHTGWPFQQIGDVGNTWTRHDWVMANSTPNVADGSIWIMVPTLSDQIYLFDEYPMQLSSGEFQWGQLLTGIQFTPNTGTTAMHIDDYYLDNTWARVEIGNNADYLLATHREMLIPSSWSPTQIQATVNIGTFATNDPVYIYVIDRHNNVSDGFGPVLIGATAP